MISRVLSDNNSDTEPDHSSRSRNMNRKTGLDTQAEEKIDRVDGEKDPLVVAILSKLDKKFESLNKTLIEFQTSLEYSQDDLDDMKKENRTLKNRITQLELEEKRNEAQMKTLEGRFDRLDTATRRRNLILDGITENQDGKDNFDPLLQQLFK